MSRMLYMAKLMGYHIINLHLVCFDQVQVQVDTVATFQITPPPSLESPHDKLWFIAVVEVGKTEVEALIENDLRSLPEPIYQHLAGHLTLFRV